MTVRPSIQAALLAVAVACRHVIVANPVSAWQTNLNGTATTSVDQATAVAVQRTGDVVGAGFSQNAGSVFFRQDFTVAKFSGATGGILWHREISGIPGGTTVDAAKAVVVDAAGNVVAAGVTGVDSESSLGRFTVVKLAGTDGSELWRYIGTVLGDEAQALAVDPNGDILALSEGLFTVVKLDGATGKEIWRQVIRGALLSGSAEALGSRFAATAPALNGAGPLVVDNTGAVVVAGLTQNSESRGLDFTVVKLSGADGLELWRDVIPSGNARTSTVAVDAAGDVVAAGAAGNPDQGFTVVKLADSSGTELWRRILDAGGEATAVAVDLSGDVIAGGVIMASGAPRIVKLSGATGAELWRSSGCDPNSDLLLSAAGVDAAGNIVGAGISLTPPGANPAPPAFTVFKLEGLDGAARWCHLIRGSANGGGPGAIADRAFAVAVNATGDAIAAGVTRNIGAGDGDFTVVELGSTDGAERWRAVLNGTANLNEDRALAVTLDPAGNVAAVGETENIATARDFTAAKLGGEDGAELWRRAISGTVPGSIDRALAVAVDPGGNIVAAGLTENLGSGADFTVIKFAGTDGSERWRQVINGTANGFDAADAVAVDAAGDVVAAGGTANTDTGPADFTVVKFAAADGSERWRRVINGSANGTDQATAITLDGAGDVVAVGFTENAQTGLDFTVVKFSGRDGSELWRQTLEGTFSASVDEAFSVTVGPAGDVVAAGASSGTPVPGTTFFQSAAFTVVKFADANGAELWRQVIRGNEPSGTNDALAVAVDAAGDVVAAGALQNVSTSSDFALVKLAGTNGTEIWRRTIGGMDIDQARAVTLNAAGDVVATGITSNAPGIAFTVVKVAGSGGEQQWRRDIYGTAHTLSSTPTDNGLAVVVDPAGDVVAAGFTENVVTGFDFTVAKLNGEDGTLVSMATPTPSTPTATSTRTPTPSQTAMLTRTSAVTPTNTSPPSVTITPPTPPVSVTPTETPQPTHTATPTETQIATPSETPTLTPTPFAAVTPSNTSPPSATITPRTPVVTAPVAARGGGCSIGTGANTAAGWRMGMLTLLGLGAVTARRRRGPDSAESKGPISTSQVAIIVGAKIRQPTAGARPSRQRIWDILLPLALGVACGAASRADPIVPLTPSEEEPRSPSEFAVITDRVVYRQGETIQVTLRLHSDTATRWWSRFPLTTTFEPCNSNVMIRDAAGGVVYDRSLDSVAQPCRLYLGGPARVHGAVHVPPAFEIVATVPLARNGSDRPGAPLPPGRYSVEGTLYLGRIPEGADETAPPDFEPLHARQNIHVE